MAVSGKIKNRITIEPVGGKIISPYPNDTCVLQVCGFYHTQQVSSSLQRPNILKLNLILALPQVNEDVSEQGLAYKLGVSYLGFDGFLEQLS